MRVRSLKPRSGCAIKLLTGASAGKEIDLAKPFTTLGQPELQVALITGHADGYCLSHVAADVYPQLNGHPIGSDVRSMSHGDEIYVAGTRMKFLAY
jgi:hypothetical protein